MTRWKDALLNSDELFKRKRDAVVRQAAIAFSENGFHGTSLDDIAKTLRVTKAALYHYVSGKQEILYECHKIALDLGDQALARIYNLESTGREKIASFLLIYIEMLAGELGSCAVLTDLSAMTDQDRAHILQRRDQFDRTFRKLISEGVEDGSIAPCDPRLVGFLIMGAVNWIPRWYKPGGERTPKEIADQFVQTILNGLAPHR
jgi:TetR/AcrR family transcriptional regulator